MKEGRESAANRLDTGLGLGEAILMAALILCLSSCGSAFQRADLREFIETGVSMVSLQSSIFDAGSGRLSLVPSGKTITGSLAMINPKSFEVAYTLGWDVENSLFSTLPATSPAAGDTTHLSFSFALDPATAEHKTITFSLGKYVASLNKTYDKDSFSFVCDSPPDAALGLATAEDSSARAFLAFVLPSGAIDDDLASMELSWDRILGDAAGSATYSVTELAAIPANDPIGDGNSLNRYFCPSIDAGYAYGFSVVLVDSKGQRSSPASATSTPHPYALVYDGNGSEGGDLPATATYNVEDGVTVADCGKLYKTDYTFVYWNSAPDNSGSIYRTGSIFAMGATALTLYAQWAQNGNLVSFDIGTQAIAFSLSSATIARGTTLVASCGNATLALGGSDWRWYVDGVRDEGQADSTFSWPTAGLQPGQYEIGCSVTHEGFSYSGSFRITVSY